MKQVLVMRKDLPSTGGKLVAQGAHAALGSFVKNFWRIRMWRWLRGDFKKITVRTDSWEEFEDVRHRALAAGLLVTVIKDAGHTIYKQPTVTCMAIGPDTEERLQPVTGKLKLL